MTPGPKPLPRPICARPGCGQRVKRPHNKTCSKRCHTLLHPEWRCSPLHWYQVNVDRQRIQALIAECKALMDDQQRIAAKDVARLLVRERHQAYNRGYNACRARILRGRAA